MSKKNKTASVSVPAAMRDLLDYIGGSDVTQTDHPIYVARAALKRLETAAKVAVGGVRSADSQSDEHASDNAIEALREVSRLLNG